MSDVWVGGGKVFMTSFCLVLLSEHIFTRDHHYLVRLKAVWITWSVVLLLKSNYFTFPILDSEIEALNIKT